MSTYELLDELEAGELSVAFEGEEPETVLEWAIERFSPRIGVSTAFQIDGVAIIDMTYRIDPEVRIFSVDTGRLPAYDIFVRGSLGPDPAIARPVFRRVPSDGLEAAVEGLIRGWLDGRRGESFTEFQRRLSDEELGVLAQLEPARSRREVEAAA